MSLYRTHSGKLIFADPSRQVGNLIIVELSCRSLTALANCRCRDRSAIAAVHESAFGTKRTCRSR
jgi:hypothetical protein